MLKEQKTKSDQTAISVPSGAMSSPGASGHGAKHESPSSI